MGHCFAGLGYDFCSCDFAAEVIGVYLVALFSGSRVDIAVSHGWSSDQVHCKSKESGSKSLAGMEHD